MASTVGESGKILLVDDEKTVLCVLRHTLEARGCVVRSAGSAEEGLDLLRRWEPALVLIDIVLPRMDGVEMLRRVKQHVPRTEVIIMTSHASIESAVEAIRHGAYDYLQKPLPHPDELWMTVRRALEKRALSVRNSELLIEQEIKNRELSESLERSAELIAALQATREQLVFSERSKAIGQMAAGVAHDFNNALAVILGRTEFCLGKLRDNRPGIESDLVAIEKVALQAAETIKRIQDYTRARTDRPEVEVDLNAVVRDAVEINRPKWKDECQAQGRGIAVRLDLGEPVPVRGNAHELIQVVSNLLFNAVEAMPDGGELSFRSMTDGEWVVLEVSDTGVGMTEETRQRLFEPYFTTKESGHGLGASIVYGIIARHQGEISLVSRCGAGTTFRIRLPRARSGVERPPVVRAPVQTEFRAAHVLLVDDDADVLQTYRDVLAACGHRVTVAHSGAEALALLDGSACDVVVTDLSMPGMSGLDVARSIGTRSPGTPVILISGWAVEPHEPTLRACGVHQVLGKPCPNEVLLEAIQDALRQTRLAAVSPA